MIEPDDLENLFRSLPDPDAAAVDFTAISKRVVGRSIA